MDGGTSIYIVTRYSDPGNILKDGWGVSVNDLCDEECEEKCSMRKSVKNM